MLLPWTGPAPEIYALLSDTGIPSVDADASSGFFSGPGFLLFGASPFASDDGAIAAVLCNVQRDATTRNPRRDLRSVTREVVAAYRKDESPEHIASLLPDAQACVVVDGRRRRLLALGDRLGTRRLYFSKGDTGTRVSSDPRLAVASNDSDEIDSQAIFDYMYFHVIPAPRSAFVGVETLPLATALTIDHERHATINIQPASWKPRLRNSSAAVTKVRDLLGNAVGRLLPEGVDQTACFLSGGLDSSSVAGFAAQALGGPNVHAFSIGFSEKAYDESEFAAAAAQQFDLTWHRHELTPPEVVDSLDEIVDAMPEPFGNSSAVAVYHCARQARKAGFDFMLAGDGGDEVFAGNSRYAKQFVFERYQRLPGLLRSGLLEPFVRAVARTTGVALLGKVQRYIEQAKVPLPDRLQSWNHLHRNPLEFVFTDTFLRRIDAEEPLALMRQEYRSCDSDDPLDRMLQLDWRFTLHDNDLVKVNSMCHLAGVDVAYPMLDRELVDFACRLPRDWRIRNGDLRWFYRNAMRGFLPDKIIDKTKHGFGLPFGVWTRTHGDLKSIAESAISALSKRGIFQNEFLQDTLAKHRDVHAGYYGELIWILMILELWLQKRSPELGF